MKIKYVFDLIFSDDNLYEAIQMRQKAEDTTKMFFASSTIFGMSLNRYNRMYALVNTRLISIISFMFMNLKRE